MQRIRSWTRALVTLNGSPRGIAAGFALGLGLSLMPIPFAGMLLALGLAPVFRFNLAATYLGSAVINPVTGPFFYFSELWLGSVLMGQDILPWAQVRGMDIGAWWDLFRIAIPPFLLGAAVLAVTLGPLSFLVLRVLAAGWQERRNEHGRPPGEPAAADDDSSSST